ncbi:eCIS core domain-containing protein [Roseitranquillus sediminis]|uniref:eCIS core domain-containing protein n=1 Tax=Roseitranquillus sediminis TaxID=2809051 RepID=UPI001D0BF4DF|nr:DUF4157 domain-containing protein [Roseitranquillus sediminis]MBM9594971.1 DUF4157 domain-containing protein [Roseitranquillus sediminis]
MLRAVGPALRVGPGRPLPRAERTGYEAALDCDLSLVRLHAGPAAAAAADERRAVAFAHGTAIVLGRQAQAASPAGRRGIVAHELIHVVQQTAPPQGSGWRRPPARAPPVRPVQRAAPAPQNIDYVPDFVEDAASAVGDFGGDVYEGAVDIGSEAIEGAAELASRAGDLVVEVGGVVLEGAEEIIDYVAPGLLDFLRGDFLDDLEELFCSGIDGLLGLLLDPLSSIDIMSGLESVFESLASSVASVPGAIGSAASSALGLLIQPLIWVIDNWGSGIIDTVQSLSNGVEAVFSALWENIAKPVIDFLGSAGSAVWDAFTGLVTWIWDLASPIRDAAEFAWDWLMEKFGLAWDSTSGVRTWLEEKAEAAWTAFLEVIEPIREPLTAVAGILVLISPLGPILILTQVLPPIWDKLKWLAANWREAGVVVWARETLEKDILPFLIGVVDGVKALISGAAGWLAGVVASVARAMQGVVALFSTNRCLRSVDRVLEHVADQFERLQAWADGGFAGLEDAVGDAFEALRGIFQPILDFLVRLAIVAVNPPMLPVAIAGAIWLLLPDEFKPPVINFVLDLLIAFLPAFAAFLAGLGPMVMVLKSAALGFLRRLRSGEVGDETRIAGSNKVANLCAGAGPQFIAGYALGLLQGLIEGIIDPFKLLFMLMELIVTGVRVLKRVLAPYMTQLVPTSVSEGLAAVDTALAVPAPAEPATETPVGSLGARGPPEAAEAETAPAAEAPATPSPVEAPATQPAAEAPAAAPSSGPSAAPGAVAEAAEGEAGATPQGAAAEEVPLDAEGVASDADIAGGLPPGTLTEFGGLAEPEAVSADALENDMRTEVRDGGGTVSGLADMLGGAWEWLMQKAGELGGWIAGKFLQFLALPDYELGNKIGWLSGMILLEVLIAYFTAGGYTVLKQGASLGRRLLSYMLRFLDIGGEILGVLGRALAPLKGPILRGFGAAKGFLQRFDFIAGLLTRIEDLARSLFRFGDEAAEAATHAPAGRAGSAAPAPRAPDLPRAPDAPRAPDVPRAPEAPAPRAPEVPPTRTPAEVTDAGERAARDAMDATPARQGREAVEDLGDGSLRAVDEPGVPQVRDDALKAAQLAEARIAAEAIAATNDAVDTPIPLVLAQLMVLKRRYRWIDTFRARRLSAVSYDLEMIASNWRIRRYLLEQEGELDDELEEIGLRVQDTPPAGMTTDDKLERIRRLRENQLKGDITEARHNLELGGTPGRAREIFPGLTYDDLVDQLDNGNITFREFADLFPNGAEQLPLRVLDEQTGRVTTRVVDRMYHEGGSVILRESKGVTDLPLDNVSSRLRSQIDRDLWLVRTHPGVVIEWRIDATALTPEQIEILRRLMAENAGRFRVSPASLLL